MLQQMAINALWRLPMILVLGYYTSLLINISRQERGGSLHDYSILQKIRYWFRLTTPNALVFSGLLGVIYLIARAMGYLHGV